MSESEFDRILNRLFEGHRMLFEGHGMVNDGRIKMWQAMGDLIDYRDKNTNKTKTQAKEDK